MRERPTAQRDFIRFFPILFFESAAKRHVICRLAQTFMALQRLGGAVFQKSIVLFQNFTNEAPERRVYGDFSEMPHCNEGRECPVKNNPVTREIRQAPAR
jgi:hypothetical protein